MTAIRWGQPEQLLTEAPETFLGVEVPEDIKAQWQRWEGTDWRRNRYWGTNNLFPPDQRFSVRPPQDMCPKHRAGWTKWRNHRFDPVTGNRWPGCHGSPFTPISRDLDRVRNERRCEWEEKCRGQMLMIEGFCRNRRNCGDAA
ncbi:hypothetical protein ACIQU4_28645 [Streptomyces sp. NPDC090741]|uniref:hypothetical protein n=1 Tax=Streptomyces sp. NPDC090741 TaxID=3365967 RepID=UPI00381D470E